MSPVGFVRVLPSNRFLLAGFGILTAAGLVLVFLGAPLRAQTTAYLHPPNPTINVGERVSIGAYDVPVGEIAYIRMTGPIKPEGRCGASAQAQPRAPGPSPGPGYYDSLWVEGRIGGRIYVDWTAPSNNGGAALTGYHVQRKLTTDSAWPGGSDVVEPDTPGGIPPTEHTVVGLTRETHSLWVFAGHGASAAGDGGRVACTVFARTTVIVRGAPGPIRNLRLEGRIGGRIYVDWTAPSNNGGAALTGTDYHVQRKLTTDSAWPGGSDVVEPDTPGGIPPTEHTVENLIGGSSTYNVRVQACNGLCGGWTYGTEDVPVDTHRPPGTVRELRVEELDARLILTWKIPSDTGSRPITGYHVQNDEGSPGWPGGVSVIDSSVHTDIADKENLAFTIEPLVNDRTYRVRVQACNGLCGRWEERSGTPGTDIAPGRIATLNITSEGESLTVSWSAPSDGGSPITRYEVQYKETSASWPPEYQATRVTRTQTTITGLTSGTIYDVRVRACNDVGCGVWTSNSTTSEVIIMTLSLGTNVALLGMACNSVTAPPPSTATTLNAPTDLEVIPYPGRRAALVWEEVAGATGYVVEVRKFGAGDTDWETPNNGNTTKRCYEVNLDEITTSSGSFRGLADEMGFDFRVTAKNADGTSDPSEPIILIDTPITKADGNSPASGPGEAELTWTPMNHVLNSSFAGGTYRLRYRKSNIHLSNSNWRPGTYASDEVSDPVSTNTDTIEGLDLRAIYAIQLFYETDGVPPVFAARDVYVWPSDLPASSRSYIATYPLNYPVANKTFDYSICDETFPKFRRSKWTKLIKHALGQWQLATGGDLITMDYTGEPCPDFSTVIKLAAQSVAQTISDNPLLYPDIDMEEQQLLTRIQQDVAALAANGLVRRDEADKRLSEIIMFDDVDGHIAYFWDVAVFNEIAFYLGYFACWETKTEEMRTGTRTAACTIRSDHPDGGSTSDIFLRRSEFQNDLLRIPGPDESVDRDDVQFNKCLVENHKAYAVLVHEAGHALGIRQDTQSQSSAHPTVSDSVMTANLNAAFGCSPQPLDVMVMYALYQSR